MLALDYIADMLVGLLPERYRSWYRPKIGLHRAAIPSGVIQCLCSLAILFHRYLDFIERRIGTIGSSAIARGKEETLAAAGVQHTIGLFVLLQYLLTPASLLLVYLMLEGVVRLLAGTVNKEGVGTLPLQLISWIHGRVGRAVEDRKFGPRVVDGLARGDGKSFDLRIASCRPKPGWNHLMTVSFNDVLYEVVDEKKGSSPRPFLYLLKKQSPGKTTYRIHYYRPDELLDRPRRPSHPPR